MEGVGLMSFFTVDTAKCIKCGICVKLCPAAIIEFAEDGFPAAVPQREARCINCGQCALFCPTCAAEQISMPEESLVLTKELALPSAEEGLNLLKTRRSIRKFKEENLSRETFDKIFKAVKQAPTAVNRQPVRWIVSADMKRTKEIQNLVLCWLREEIFKDPLSRPALIGAAAIAKAKNGEDILLRGAPNIAFAVVPGDCPFPEDGTIALTYLELAAHALGVGCCWGGYLTTAVRSFRGLQEYIGLEENEHLCGAQLMGWPLYKPVREFPARRDPGINWLS